jgi:hypothetical protein
MHSENHYTQRVNRMRIAAAGLAGALLSLSAAGQYPSAGNSIAALPDGSIPITFRGSTYYFNSGFWYQQVVAGFVPATPPQGVVVPSLPSTSTTVWLAGVPYYRLNDIYYASTPGGYMVVAPPTSQGSLYYCVSSKAYYPKVADCAEGWSILPTVPPQLR